VVRLCSLGLRESGALRSTTNFSNYYKQASKFRISDLANGFQEPQRVGLCKHCDGRKARGLVSGVVRTFKEIADGDAKHLGDFESPATTNSVDSIFVFFCAR
jgi:hypothetical protein